MNPVKTIEYVHIYSISKLYPGKGFTDSSYSVHVGCNIVVLSLWCSPALRLASSAGNVLHCMNPFALFMLCLTN